MRDYYDNDDLRPCTPQFAVKENHFLSLPPIDFLRSFCAPSKLNYPMLLRTRKHAPQSQLQPSRPEVRPQFSRAQSADYWTRHGGASGHNDSRVRRTVYEIGPTRRVDLGEDQQAVRWSQSAGTAPASVRTASPKQTASPSSVRSIRSEPPIRHSSTESRSISPLHTRRRPRRVNILVFGSTGVGKSTFIRKLVKRGGSRSLGPRQGHSLESCTNEYEGFLYTTPDEQEVMLVDTPGFDDSRFSDAENLADLAKCLQRMQKQGQRIDGIIFISPITDVRLRGAALKMVEVIKRVCGERFFRRVALVTSMWDLIESKHRATAENRERMMLKTPQFWGDFHQGMAKSFQFINDISSASAVVQWLVIQSLSGRDNAPMLRMSQELQEGRILSETDAGGFLLGELSKQRERHVEAVEDLRREIRKAQQSGDLISATDFAEEEEYETSCAQEVDSACWLLNSRNVLVR